MINLTSLDVVLYGFSSGVFLASVWSATSDNKKIRNGTVFDRLSLSHSFRIFQFLAAICLVAPAPAWCKAFFSIALVAISITGVLVRAVTRRSTCDCFGAGASIPSWFMFGIACVAVVAAIASVAAAIEAPFSTDGEVMLALPVALAFGIGLRIYAIRTKGNLFKTPEGANLEPPKDIPLTVLLGADKSGRKFYGHDVAKLGKPVLMLLVSNSCQACHVLLAQIGSVADELRDYFSIFVISASPIEENIAPSIFCLRDKRSALFRHTRSSYLPLVLYADDRLKLKIPPVVSQEKTLALLNILLSIVREDQREMGEEPAPGSAV